MMRLLVALPAGQAVGFHAFNVARVEALGLSKFTNFLSPARKAKKNRAGVIRDKFFTASDNQYAGPSP
jgi:hypothetical protein